jgi:phytoene/squalene synthetase
MQRNPVSNLARTITFHSSLQTYLTIKLLVDKKLVNDCYKAYAYLRWLDDQVDIHRKTRKSRLDFIKRQKQLITDTYSKRLAHPSCREEEMIIELITSNPYSTKLSSFLINFFKIIAFDAQRRYSQISEKKLLWYSTTLAKAVTDGIEYFINTTYAYPDTPSHYRAAIGSHITHMLRDYQEDIPQGFINIPNEYITKYALSPLDVTSPKFLLWVRQQVKKARKEFREGKCYIKKLPILRGKIAALWYCARFENILDEIEKDKYILRPRYANVKFKYYVRIFFLTLQIIFIHELSLLSRK